MIACCGPLLAVAVARLRASSRRAAAAPPSTFTDVDDAGRHPLRPQQRRLRQEVPARDDGRRRACSSTSDADGWQDLLFVNSTELARPPGPRRSLPALYRNNRDGTFTDVTRGSGLDVEIYGIGAAAADFDNDGKVDVYVTALGGNRLFRNLGGGKFADVTDAGRRRRRRVLDQRALVRLRQRRQARPVRRALRRVVDRQGSVLHARRQEQVVLHAGILQGPEPVALPQPRRRHVRERDRQGRAVRHHRRRGSAWRCSTSTATAGWTCSSPTTPQPNRLYRNKGNGTFEDVAVGAGVAFSEAGVARAGMGVDAADYDGSGRPSLIIGNFSNEMMALYHNEGKRPVHRRCADVGDRPGVAADADLRLLLLRLRSRRPARHLRGQRPRRRRHRAGAVARAPTRSGRTCSGTPATKQFEDVPAAGGPALHRADGRRAARPTPITTTTATSTSS